MRAQSPLRRTVQVRMTLQGDVMVFNSPERNVILPGSSGLVCKLRPGAVLFCDFAVKDFDRQGRKVNAKDAKMGGTPRATWRDRQSSEHWRDIAGTAYNPARAGFLTRRLKELPFASRNRISR